MSANKSYKTTCSYCGVGCGIIVNKDNNGTLKVTGDTENPVNKGMLCSKGMNLHYVAQDTTDRILYPEMKWSKNHPLKRVSWDTAFERAAAVFKSIIKKHGPDSVGFYVSGQCLTEEYYLVNKLTKGFIGTNNIDTNSRLCMSSAVVGYKKALGEDSVPIAYADIELADTFLITGANPAWCHPILYRRLEAHKEANPDTKFIVVDPRKTQTAAIADLHLQIQQGTDVVLNNAIVRELIETDKIDIDFIFNHTNNFEDVKKQVFETSLEDAAKICDVSLDDIRLATKYIGDAKGFISMWTMGLNQSIIGVDKNVSLLNISLVTGQIGKPGSGPFSLTGQPNAMGGREVGGMANLLAVHKDLMNPTHRKEVSDFWGSNPINPKPGYTATKMFDALDKGDLKAIWIICTNPVVSLPNSNKVERALKKAKFVVVQDISHNSETTKYADLLLPAAGWLEKEGTMSNSERRISYLEKGIEPPGEALPDVEILWRFAQAMNYRGFDYKNAEEVYKEYCKMTKGTNIDISGLSYQKLRDLGTVQWPFPSEDSSGTPRLFTDKKFYTPNGKANFNVAQNIYNQSEQPTDEFPLILNTGRIRDQWHTRTKTGKVKRLLTHISGPYVEINEEDAKARDIEEGTVVVVKNNRGTARVKAIINKDIKKGSIFMPMHFGKISGSDFGRANNLTNELIDPISSEPDFKHAVAQVTKFKKEKQKICLVGAGSASYRFIQTYREHNTEDELDVFSLEPYPFYNRVMLPEYINEEMTWEQLQKIKKGELEKLKVTLHANCSIIKVNREEKTILDSNGNKHHYDILIMATGSRAFIPKDYRIDMAGAFTMRTKKDADALKAHLEKTGLPQHQQHVTIVGGGLLGLELAASLSKIDIKSSIIQRANRLMERQLDLVSSRLLDQDVKERGIQIHYNNEVDTVFETNKETELEVRLKTGKIIKTNAIVYAIGTIPNIELGRDIKLKCGRGIEVNQHLQSSDPNIFALGEIAQYNGWLFGITSAAEQQADVAAKYILGDLGSVYDGSVLMNILKFENLDLCSIGNIEIPKGDNSYEQIILTDERKRYYKKCVVKDDILIGAVLMGDKKEFAEFKALIEDRVELSDKRDELLRGSGGGEPVIGKLVCSCSQVGDGNLKQAIAGGCTNFAELCKTTGAGLGCGSCKPEVRDILKESLTPVNA
ncbi:molybdopterin-dependent oxidoreductase [Wenyingzhuangia sp. chi5]|uniref:Molybdopterin-dependent oxidoreductase n=1 Tax=Wenyingzhuangia gilva TaxID=3057677 RepID=A0ABT8VNM3_9FLAO|nr:nitrate reductase [Wenyingzhuangia sp. chi5]MDO3693557.1 molybdopterin-dependent oxidoreductase [Wenyingzhuangia sp. chi5]